MSGLQGANELTRKTYLLIWNENHTFSVKNHLIAHKVKIDLKSSSSSSSSLLTLLSYYRKKWDRKYKKTVYITKHV